MLIKFFAPVVLAAGLFTSIGCRGGMMGRDHGPGAMIEARLKITPDQKAAIHDVMKRHKPALAAKVETLVQARNEAMDTGMDPSVSAEAWRVEQEKVADSMYGVAKEVRSAYLDLLPILSDSQKSEAKEMLKKFHSHMGKMHQGHHEFAFQFVKNRLELTDAQATAIKGIAEKHQGALQAKHATLHQAFEAMMEAGLDPATSQATLDQRFATVKEAGFAMSSEVRATYLEIVPQLTPEQRDSAKELVKDFRNVVDSVRKLLLGF
jgi:Spy/CpxP family protein refolding chaperone